MGKKIVILFLVILMFSLASVSAEKPYKKDLDAVFIHIITEDNKIVDNIQANITFTYDGKTLVANQPMTYNTIDKNFNYTLDKANITQAGTYTRCITANNGTDWAEAKCFNFEVTASGEELSPGVSALYIFSLVILLSLFILSIFGATKINGQPARNEFNEIVEINWKKYSKMGLWAMSYIFFMFIIFIMWNLSFGFLGLPAVATVFKLVFYILFALTFPLFVFAFVWVIINYTTDRYTQKAFDSGVSSMNY